MLKKVMAIIKSAQADNVQKLDKTETKSKDPQLTQVEIEFILTTLRECSFKGTQVVELYNTVLKLQQQHKAIQEK
tara:strand:+ start:258 stop:482 length:225 start_codon:yes stop_codon:yes gene_type:complete